MSGKKGGLVKQQDTVDAIPIDSVGDLVNIGEWYWVTLDDTEYDEGKDEEIVVGHHDELLCVAHIGSNFVELKVYSGHHNGTSGYKIDFKEFADCSRIEPNWRAIIKGRAKEIQDKLRAKVEEITAKAQSLSLIAGKKALSDESQSLLPTVATKKPDQYKRALVKAKDKDFPQLTKEIEELNSELSTQTRNMYLPDMVKVDLVKNGIEKIEDQLFTVELYCGIKEQVAHIKKGTPAPKNEPISIRQMLLYMDEECLIDYKSGGMDFKTLKQFDKWVVKKKNLERILPEERAVVAMQVRRNVKDYVRHAGGNPLDWLVHFGWNRENMHSYLLIRNGSNVYRIATQIDFSPRLIPKTGDLMSEEAFTKKERIWGRVGEDDKYIGEKITPDHIDYDEFLEKEVSRIKQYNRIILILQGLIDRTNIFQPMPRVNLTDSVMTAKWCKMVRDEENIIDSPPVPWEEYQNALNSTLRKGKVVYGVGRSSLYKKGYNARPYNESMPPDFSYVDNVNRDGSAVRISWPWGMTAWGQGYDREPRMSTKRRHAWVKKSQVINVSDYNLGDYEMFLLNRHARSDYIAWARYLLAAEDFKRGDMKGYKGPSRDDYYQMGQERRWRGGVGCAY